MSNTRPALLASAPVSVVPSAVLAISIFLSSTRNVATSILVVSPSITILPVTLRSPSMSKVYSGSLKSPASVLLKIPTLAVLASTYIASTLTDPRDDDFTRILIS